MYLLLGTADCHLCEQAAEIIHNVQKRHPIDVQEVDIAEHEHWQADYATRIPVLYHSTSGAYLSWPFNEHTLELFINELKND